MIGTLFRSFLYSTPGELVFTMLFSVFAYELVFRPTRVVEEPKDWLLVATFAVVAAIAIFRATVFLLNSRHLEGLKLTLYKIQKACLLTSAVLFFAAIIIIFHLFR